MNSSISAEEDWTLLDDPNERRKIQNRIAQRKFRDKIRQQKEDTARQANNERLAAGMYMAPCPEDVETTEETGLPWGSFSMKHVIRTGHLREQSSRETSLRTAASDKGVTSRLGLQLVDHFAKGAPAWAAWRDRAAA
ncbi:uncharacterized protein RCC_04258 [Ramularia collo-cygni]|uniref:BZIP domain-containing protein n=1 Tax=Ramularia collo-cygni TaxID=112498 RepID=A0A2D3VD02_9PEZI|nr:uncharacterized protein RCC_04258 [Ramularia collo-cygni]CZT18413.1 uncharacterized protein RCC_04258 [Ramularia collo-cygni]